jgi:hypothetical protein
VNAGSLLEPFGISLKPTGMVTRILKRLRSCR